MMTGAWFKAIQKAEEIELHKGDIVFVQSDHWISKLIRVFTKEPDEPSLVNHVALYIGSGMITESAGGVVALRPFTKYINKDCKIAIGNKDYTTDEKQKILEVALAHSNLRWYGFRNIGLQALDFVFQTDEFTKRWASETYPICSQHVAEILEEAAGEQFGDDGEPLPPRSLTPDDLADTCRDQLDGWDISYSEIEGL